MKSIVIVGTPRSGTQRVHSAFGHAKVGSAWETDHENITISCFLAADVDDYNHRHRPYWDRHVDEVWHQTRHPLHCIVSMADVTPPSVWVWQHPITGLHPRNYRSRREFCAYFWARWNEECERRGPIWQYRVEDFERVWPEMWKRLDLGEAPEISPRSMELDRSSQREPMTWDELRSFGPTVHDNVRRLAEKYGYET